MPVPGYLYVIGIVSCCRVCREIANASIVVLGSPATSGASSGRKFDAAKSLQSVEPDGQLVTCPLNCYYGYATFVCLLNFIRYFLPCTLFLTHLLPYSFTSYLLLPK